MNLHGIVQGAIGAINPPVYCILQVSSGNFTAPDGTRVPQYATYNNIQVDVQSLSYTDLMKLGSLNIEGTRRKAYMNGNVEGLNRSMVKGGDKLIMPSLAGFLGPTTWLVVQVLEHWDDWTCLAITLQNGG